MDKLMTYDELLNTYYPKVQAGQIPLVPQYQPQAVPMPQQQMPAPMPQPVQQPMQQQQSGGEGGGIGLSDLASLASIAKFFL